ncbi:hypothetical protein [Saccharopolyspora rosea]|uniref:ABC-2 type transport system permease protein n=1 Tax=Saccharopolyspora rosea TaxID=524884 RepID=A0ABW3FJ39_9PSEU|nr:hypothetical protein [Saccharopolyspora rosea]
MTLLAAERIKLFSTRSPWWCIATALVLTIGFTSALALNTEAVPVGATQAGHQFGLMVVMVLAALSVTTEYRFGTIRATFQAVPNRTAALLAKTVVVAVVALLIGEACAFGSLGAAAVLAPQSNLALDSADAWRHVAGVGLVFALTAVLAVAVGTLLRQTAGAVTLLLLWSLLVENLVQLIPRIGGDLHQWMPFTMADNFLGADSAFPRDVPLGPWGSLGYFAGVAVVLLAIAVAVANRRDA